MIRHVYMDERFANSTEPKAVQATAMTCVVIDPAGHASFRSQFYALIEKCIERREGVFPRLPALHGMNLLPGSDDQQKLIFFQGLVDLALELDFGVYRIGYRKNRHEMSIMSDERDVLPLCFMSVLLCIQEDYNEAVVWPFMELDRGHERQDQHFAAKLQNLDWMTHTLGGASMSLDNSRLGEVHYHAKQSAYGALTDCFSYLLHQQFRREVGVTLSPFKARIASIADSLAPALRRNEVIDLVNGLPPKGYVSNGPLRYFHAITPAD